MTRMFEYDPEKSTVNLAKHGIDFETAQLLWLDNALITAPALLGIEERFMVVGLIDGKLWSAVVVFRKENIRIISVRRSRPKEAKAYEDENDNG